MKRFFYIAVGLLWSADAQSIIFQGLVEAGITKNSFFCPASATGSTDCSNVDSGAIGYHVSGSQPLQFFNNQSYWLKQETDRETIVHTDLKYSGASLRNKMISEGWVAMGGYCILISISPILTDLIMPAVKASGGNIKVIVQLWYNGSQLIQLWSQDAAVLPQDKGFKVLITSDLDSQIAKLPALASEKTFLGKLGLQQNNRLPEYAQATGAPRSVKIQVLP